MSNFSRKPFNCFDYDNIGRQLNPQRENNYENRRFSDSRGPRDNNGGSFSDRRDNKFNGQASNDCFYCKQVGHRKIDCPQLKLQQNKRQGFMSRNNHQKPQNKDENFVYEENCAPPEDEDWGGGVDSEEEKKKKKKESKKAKRQLQEQEEANQESNVDQKDISNNEEYRGIKQEQEQVEFFNGTQEKGDTIESFQISQQSKQDRNNIPNNNIPDDEDWGGNGEDADDDKKNSFKVKKETSFQNEAQNQPEISLESQIRASLGSSEIGVHPTRVIEGDSQRRSIHNHSESGYERRGSDFDKKLRDRSKERSRDDRDKDHNRDRNRYSNRDENNDSSKERRNSSTATTTTTTIHRDSFDNKFHRQKSSEYSSKRGEGSISSFGYKEDRDSKRGGQYHDDKRRGDDSNHKFPLRSDDNKSFNRNRNNSNDNDGYKARSGEIPLRDNQWKQQYRINSEPQIEQDEITSKIHQTLMSKAFGGPQVDLSDLNCMKEENEEKEQEEHEEWTLDDVKTIQVQQSDKNESAFTNNVSKNVHRFADFNTTKNYGNSHNNSYNRNGSYHDKQQSSSSYINSSYSKNRSIQPIVIISDDEEDPWSSPRNKKNTQAHNYGKSDMKSSGKNTTSSVSKTNLADLLNSKFIEFPPSPVYEPNADEEYSTKKKTPGILFNPDENNENGETERNSHLKELLETFNANIDQRMSFEKLGIENIYNFDEETIDDNDLHLKAKYSDNIKIYKEIPYESIKLGYDKYSEFFKQKIMNFLYPHKKNDDNCFKVFEGEMRFKQFTENGSLTIKINCQVFTNHTWDQIKWVPSLKLLNVKERLKDFKPVEFQTVAKQLSQMNVKEKYDRIFYLYWIEGSTQEDQDKLEEYSNYLYQKRLLSGINLENGCLTLGSINQIFPSVETFQRKFQANKGSSVKLVLIFNPEIGFQVSFKQVPF